jgi:hypothetical protein
MQSAASPNPSVKLDRQKNSHGRATNLQTSPPFVGIGPVNIPDKRRTMAALDAVGWARLVERYWATL